MGITNLKKTNLVLAIALVLAMIAGLASPALGQTSIEKLNVLITFDHMPGEAIKRLIGRYCDVSERGFNIIPTISATVSKNMVNSLSYIPGVVSVEVDGQVWALEDTLPWGVDRIDAEEVHPYNKGNGIKVAIIDSGIDTDHPDLNVLGGRRFYSQGSEDDNYDDAHGHGTHVAGTVAALDNGSGVIGVAPEVDLYAVRVLSSSGGGYWSDVIKGIEWSISNDMDVINMSLGGSSASTALRTACDAANEAGIVVVAAAGNSGNSYAWGDRVLYPAKYDSVIAVASVNSSDSRASSSSTGPAVELAAPGVSIYSSCRGGGYCTMSGTSMASPHVAGLSALILASGVSDTNTNGRVNDEVRQIMIDTADDLGPTGRDTQYGYGIIDADEAASGPANTPPVAVIDNYAINEDLDLIVSAPGVLNNDSDAESDPLSAIEVTGPSNGVLSLNSDGSFTYTPDSNFNDSDSFTYKANDGLADSNTATVNITVNPVDDTPTAEDNSYSVDMNTTLNVPVDGVLGNDDDVDGDSLSAVLVSDVDHGTLSLNSNGSFSYTPVTDYVGPDSFTYKANDGTYDSNIATVSINVTPVNYAPVAVNDSYSTDEDSDLIIATLGILGNDTDANGDTLFAIEVAGPSDGSLSLSSDGSFTYSPDSNFNGGDSFTYKANDGTLDSNIATVSITVNSINDIPTAVNNSYSVDMNSTLNVSADGVLGNDDDEDGDSLSAVLVSDVSHGTLSLYSDGSFDYTPTTDYVGPDSFTYKANDGTDDSNIATVSINVTPVNYAPVAVNDAYSTDEDSDLTVATLGVLGNDTDANSDTLFAVEVAGPSNGSLTLNSDGSFTYSPDSNFNGGDSFTYKANDAMLESNIATVSLTVNSINDAPAAEDNSYSVDMNSTLNVPADGVLGNDEDVEGDSLTAVLVSDVSHGTLNLNSDGSFDYSPTTDYEGPDSFTYKANDGTDDSNIATVSISVIGTIPPTAIYVDSIDMTLIQKYSGWLTYAEATVTVVDNVGSPVSSAKVYGHWEEATHDTEARYTNSSGYLTVISNRLKRPSSGTTFTFVVDNIVKTGWDYYPDANNETDDSISVP